MSLALIQDSSLKSMALIFSRVGRAENFSYPIQSMPMCDKKSSSREGGRANILRYFTCTALSYLKKACLELKETLPSCYD